MAADHFVHLLQVSMPLKAAETIADAALQAGAEAGLLPLTVAVLDVGGHLVVLKRQDGSGNFRAASKPFGVLTEKTDGVNEILVREQTGNRSLVLFDFGDEISVQAGDEGIRFILVSGKPIKEPVAWHGPIVMNSQAELQQAFTELRQGTFIR